MKKAFLLLPILFITLFSNAQNVGIGTTTPSTKLEIKNPVKSVVKISSNDFLDTSQLIFSNKNVSNEGTDMLITSNRESGLRISSKSDIPENNNDSIMQITPTGLVGIGTLFPLNKLHVAGGVTIDNLSGSGGIVTTNNSGVLGSLPYSGNSADVLKGNGAWGNVNGIVPTGAIVATIIYNNANLISKGFTLLGSIPGYTRYFNYPITAYPSGTWAATYVKGDLSKFSAPDFDGSNLIVWADTVMYLFSNNKLYAYNPLTDIWRFVLNNSSSYSATYNSKAVWTGTEILVYGGYYTTSTNNGFRYNPATNIWTAIPTSNQPSARRDFAMHLLNNKLVVWGGTANDYSTLLNSGAMLDLATNTWTIMSTLNAPSPRKEFTSVGTYLDTMLVWGGILNSLAQTNDGAFFKPSTNTWVPINTTNAPTPRAYHSSVWSGTEMIVFGGSGDLILGVGTSFTNFNTGGKYNPTTNTWTTMSVSGAPSARGEASAIWTGVNMLISGGNALFRPLTSDSYLYNPITNSWSYSGDIGIPKNNHLSMKAGNFILVFGGAVTVVNYPFGIEQYKGGDSRGLRYFLTTTATTQTQMVNDAELYLYIKQ